MMAVDLVVAPNIFYPLESLLINRYAFYSMKLLSKGFTLIELVLYMGILSILVTAIAVIFSTVVDVQLESKATSSVDQNGRYLISKLLYDTRSASSIVTPANPGTQTNTLQITRNSINYIYSLDANSNLLLTNQSTGESNVLNSYDTQVSGLQLLRIGSGGNSDTVQVNFTVTSRIVQAKGQESRSFQTTLGLQ